MKKNRTIYQLLIAGCLLIILCPACDKSREYNGPVPDSKLVLYSFIKPDSTIKVNVQKTLFFSDMGDPFARDVSGEVYINDQLAGQLSRDPGNDYYCNVRPQRGDHVKIVARAEGIKEATGETRIPLDEVQFTLDTLTSPIDPEGYQRRIYFHIKLTDPGEGRRYYRLIISTYQYREEEEGEGAPEYGDHYFDLDNDPLLVSGNNGYFDDEDPNMYRIFTNEIFEGGTYTIKVSKNSEVSREFREWDGYRWTISRYYVKHRVSVVRIDEASYLYLKSDMLARRGQDIIEPVQVYTNVRGGVGIIGYEMHSSVSVQMPLLVFDPPWYNK